MEIKLSFLGAAQNVTGSRYLVEANGKRILVDCGLYQEHDLKDRNWEPSTIPPGEIDAALLTHAHLDHCGLFPRLVSQGFRGKIYGTRATTEMALVVMADCAKINEEDADFKRRRHEKEGRQGPHPDVPLYTVEDVEQVPPLFQGVNFNEPISIGEGIEATFHEVGHILGAATIHLKITQGEESRTIVFSGDVGRCDMPILNDPDPIGDADYILCESTYGDRLHGPQADIPSELARVINDTYQAQGNLVIPSFAIERTQDIIFYLAQLLKAHRIPPINVYVDSPMAVKVSDIFKRHPQLFDYDTTQLMRSYRMPNLTMVRTTAQSKAINHVRGRAIIIAGAGMCTGGRIKHHLIRNLPRRQNTILFVGYQASGTLGRLILEGEKKVRILGEEVQVQANIERISGFSAHADKQELVSWLKTVSRPPRHLFITHGEPEAANAFSEYVTETLGWQNSVPKYQDSVTLQ
ncbi:MAG: MBL fold metallo-hydrolase [Victivallales bacterium]|nr:MBL fold metallo-hydrolase [Victivallales bacterium]